MAEETINMETTDTQKEVFLKKESNLKDAAADGAPDNGICSRLLIILSYILVIATCPLSLLFTIKVVQEYERAVIFRLGRNIGGGAKGPGLFFILPCIDDLINIDLRTITIDVPPQEVKFK